MLMRKIYDSTLKKIFNINLQFSPHSLPSPSLFLSLTLFPLSPSLLVSLRADRMIMVFQCSGNELIVF